MEHVLVDEDSCWIGMVVVVAGCGQVWLDIIAGCFIGVVVVVTVGGGGWSIRDRWIITTNKSGSGGREGRVFFEIAASRFKRVYGLDPNNCTVSIGVMVGEEGKDQ